MERNLQFLIPKELYLYIKKLEKDLSKKLNLLGINFIIIEMMEQYGMFVGDIKNLVE